jgi:hypothetical protein
VRSAPPAAGGIERRCTAAFVEQRHGDEKRTAAENEKSHRQLQEAIAPGLKAGRAERLFKDEMVRSGFYRFKN